MSALPDLTVVASEMTKWLAKRDKLIRQAREEGHSLRAIADAAGLTHTAIAKILAR